MNESELLKKYEELYNLTKKGLSEELEAIRQLEEKSSRYLSVVGIVLGVSTLGLKFVIETILPCKTFLDDIVVTVLVIFLILTFITIVTLFTVFRTRGLSHFPINHELVEFFDQYNYLDSIFALTRGNIDAVLMNRKVRLDKIRRLSYGYILMLWSIGTLALFTCSIIARPYFNSPLSTNRSQTMTDDQQGKPSDPTPSAPNSSGSPAPKPNPTVKPPTYDTIQRGMPNPNIPPPNYEIFKESYNPKAGKTIPPPPDTTKKDK